MSVLPVYINNRDWLTTTKSLCDSLVKLADVHIVIIDNASTYEPLLDWYKTCEHNVIMLGNNGGHSSPWNAGIVLSPEEHLKRYNTECYAVSDSDINIADMPANTIDHLKEGLFRYPEAVKCGPSLKIDDLPDHNPLKGEVIGWEKRFWGPDKDSEFIDAAIDTTFAIWKNRFMNSGHICPALRAKPPYSARHMPWYINPSNPTEEERHFINNAAGCSTWCTRMKRFLK